MLQSPKGMQSAQDNKLWNFGFMLVGVLAFAYFVQWGLRYISADANVPIFLIAAAFGVFMAFNIGGNDVANSFGTSVGAGTLTIKQALLIAAVFEVSGAVIAGAEVTDTVRSGIIDLESLHVQPQDFMFLMMAALLAAASWLLIATKLGYPVSTTHSIVGGIVGAGITLGFLTNQASPLSTVQWGQVGTIAISWLLSPALGGIVSYGLYRLVKSFILTYNKQADDELAEIERQKRHHLLAAERLTDIQASAYGHTSPDDLYTTDYQRRLRELERRRMAVDPHRALRIWAPILAGFGAVVLSAMVIFKALANMNLGLSTGVSFALMIASGAMAWVFVYLLVNSLRAKPLARATFIVFSWMQVFTACGFAFSHGANDIANAIGPFVATLDVLRTGSISAEADVPGVALLVFGIALVVGLWFVGKNVIKTVGHGLTEIHPSSGFSAELAAAMVVMGASILGLPVSSTHILIGAVLGIGVANHATNWKIMKPIGLAWVVTLPAAALLSSIAFVVIRLIFG